MPTSEQRKIIIRLPTFTWKSFLTLRSIILFAVLCAVLLLTYWYLSLRPYLWISSARVDAYCSMIAPDFGGKISEMSLGEGDFIRKGQLLFSIDSEQLLVKQKQMQSSIDSFNQIMNTEKARMEKAMQDYLTSSEEVDLGIGSQAIVDNHLNLLQQAQAKSEDAQTRLVQLSQEFSHLNEQAKKRNFLAPFDAIILKKSKNLGDIAPIGEPIYALLDPQQVWIEAEVPEKEFGRIALGTPAKIRLPAYPGKEWLGKIVWISPATVSKISSLPNSYQNERIAVKIALENPEFALKPGLSAQVGLKVH